MHLPIDKLFSFARNKTKLCAREWSRFIHKLVQVHSLTGKKKKGGKDGINIHYSGFFVCEVLLSTMFLDILDKRLLLNDDGEVRKLQI